VGRAHVLQRGEKLLVQRFCDLCICKHCGKNYNELLMSACELTALVAAASVQAAIAYVGSRLVLVHAMLLASLLPFHTATGSCC
jgi:hypothetical protein